MVDTVAGRFSGTVVKAKDSLTVSRITAFNETKENDFIRLS